MTEWLNHRSRLWFPGDGELASVSPVIGEKIDDILARTLMKSAARS